MSDEEHSDSQCRYYEEQETAEEPLVAVVGILTKLKQVDPFTKMRNFEKWFSTVLEALP